MTPNLNFEEIVLKNEAVCDRIAEKTQGYAVINNRLGIAVKTTLENAITQGIIKDIVGPLVYSARSAVRDLNTADDLAFMRIATKKYEFLIAPDADFTIVVLQ